MTNTFWKLKLFVIGMLCISCIANIRQLSRLLKKQSSISDDRRFAYAMEGDSSVEVNITNNETTSTAISSISTAFQRYDEVVIANKVPDDKVNQGQDERNNGASSIQVPITVVESGKNRTHDDSSVDPTNEMVSTDTKQLNEMNAAKKLVVGKASNNIDYHPKTSALTQCHLKIERQFARVHYELNQAFKPVLYSVKIINNLFYVLFSVYDLFKEHKVAFLNGNTACNGVKGATFLNGRKGKTTHLILVCPPQINASHTILSSVSVSAERVGTNVTGMEITFYNTSLFDNCEREDIHHHACLGNATKAGIHAVFVGDRQKAFEWAAYCDKI